ncbi:SusC/RagA family TonB-linked outer membrane protein [Croceimicrobium hydrocarbonivorans]|uniref:TonB-dependent receptor n=1 Tax=Croceimicrobium hydrocarbonivorans TaxID=2761580 RepID=A0A7H0VIS0_9FLAO|nr:TonB-dependent receptor [Croceimicrobium hydrocarbonivorans]QNR25618.1 TonB-dependent receptor [Croceimicrobium hydrocarbonivorans]
MKRTLQSLFALLFSMAVWSLEAQVVKGTITDKSGEPLPGASVLVVGQSGSGTAADFDGNYSLSGLKAGKLTLEFAFIGFETKRVEVQLAEGETKTLNMALAESSSQLDEIVVVGYGVQRRREMTGNVVKIDAKKLNDMPAPSFETAIQGKAAGVQIVTGSGLAGSASVVRVRGVTSIGAGGDPLYIVDGVQLNQDYFSRGNSGGMNQNPLAFLNPDDIESVEILKDASATAIYGSRGANGVILITTKRGNKGGLQFNFSTTQGISEPTQRPQMLNSQEYLQLYREAWINDGNTGTPVLTNPALSWEEAQRNNTDWVDQVVRTGYKAFYDFSVSKGTDRYNFYAGLSYDKNQSYIIGDEYDRMSGRFNGDYRFNDKLSISASTGLTQSIYNRVDNAWSGGLGAAMSTALPYYPVKWDRYYVSAGDTVARPGDWFLQGTNPVAQRELKDWRITDLRSINNAKITYSPLKNFTILASGSLDYFQSMEDIWEPAGRNTYQTDVATRGQGTAQRYPRRSYNYNGFLTGTYDWQLNENNKFAFMVGTEYQENFTHTYYITTFDTNGVANGIRNDVFNAPSAFYESADLRNNYDFDSVTTSFISKFMSVFTRINYQYKGKYLAQLVMRTDGSSRFGPNNRFGYFPSVSAGWIISEENWMKENRFINYLKLKSSIGWIGNANLTNNEFLARYNYASQAYDGRDILYPLNNPNPDLRWETTQVIDLGLEYGLFEDRITGELAYYRKNTSDVLLNVTLPRVSGFNNFYDNVGGLFNEGFEFQIKTRNLVGEFRWTTDFNIAYNHNEIVSLGGYSADAVGGGTNDTRTIVGEPVGTNFLVRFSHVDPTTGRPVYLDIDGNPTFVWDPANRVPVGNVLPDAVGGITNNFSYKQWDLSVLFVFTIGSDIYDSSSKRQLGRMDDWNKTPHIYDRWRAPGDEATYPLLTLDAANHGSNTPWINTDQWIHDGSYLRLRNLTLSYRLNRNQLEKLGLKGAQISFIGTNLFTFTKYPGLDPEIARDFENATDRNMSVNITFLTPPQERSYSIRLNVNF